MKKYCLVTILLSVLMSMPVSAYDFEKNGIYYNIEGDHVSVTYSGNGVYTGNVSIPSQVTYNGVTYPVTAIGEWAFEGGEGMTSLTIPSSITSIGEYAFIDCGSNINVYINDLKAWCKVTFGNEHSSPLSSAKSFYSGGSVVTSLIIPDGVESIPNFAFYQCRSITSLYIPSSVKSIGSSAFEDCTGLTALTLCEGLELIGGSTFEGCTGLKILRIPSTVNVISINAFKNCTGITDVYCFAENVPVTDENAFDGTPTEKSTLHVPANTVDVYSESWPWSDFKEFVSAVKHSIPITKFQVGGIYYTVTDDYSVSVSNGETLYYGSVVIPAQVTYNGRTFSVTSIGRSAFIGSKGLTSLVIPNTVKTIGFRAFHGCKALADITFPSSLESLSSSSIQATQWYKNQPDGLIYIGTLAYKYKGKMPSNTRIYINNGTKLIADSAFYACTGLVYVSIPSSVKSIGSAAFFRCSGLNSVSIPDNVTKIGRSAFQDCSALSSITIPNGVTSIGGSAFSGTSWYNNQQEGLVYAGRVAYKYKGDMPAYTSVSIKDGTLGIGDYAFSHCNGLASIEIPASVVDIGMYAFQNCSGLKSIIIPSSVTSICEGVFSECSGLKSIIIPGNVTTIGDRAFQSCSGLNSVSISNGVTSIGNYAFQDCNGIKSIIIPNSVESIGNYSFEYCTGLTSVTISSSVTSISNYAFYNCSGLTSVTIPNSVTSIGASAFKGCSGLTSVTIPNSVTSIGFDAFQNTAWYNNQPDGLVYAGKMVYNYKGEMPADTHITIEDGTLGISGSAFSGCKGLTSIDIPNSLVSIDVRAFNGCSGLTSLTIPNSVTSIGNYAFSGCYGLTSVNIPNSLTTINRGAFSGCSSLNSVNIPNSVTSIGRFAFSNCVSLTTVKIPKDVSSLGCAFYDCFSLTSVISEIENPFIINDTVFWNIKSNAELIVPKGTRMAYKSTSGWKKFQNIKEMISGDINLDDKGNKDDLKALVDFIMGKNPEGFYESLADLNGDEKVNAADVVMLIDVISSSGLSTGCQMYYDEAEGSRLVSSMTCTLNNKRNEAIELTKCELYCNQKLVSNVKMEDSLASGGSITCSFDNLAKYASMNGFTVCWHYTSNDENYIYRCKLDD